MQNCCLILTSDIILSMCLTIQYIIVIKNLWPLCTYMTISGPAIYTQKLNQRNFGARKDMQATFDLTFEYCACLVYRDHNWAHKWDTAGLLILTVIRIKLGSFLKILRFRLRNFGSSRCMLVGLIALIFLIDNFLLFRTFIAATQRK